MVDLLGSHQSTLVLQPLDDLRIRLRHLKTREGTCLIGQHTIVINGHEDGQIELQAHSVVILAMTRGGVHSTGARIQGDMIAVDDLAREIMANGGRVGQPEELLALHANRLSVASGKEMDILPARNLGHVFH